MIATNFPTYDRMMQPTLDALHALGGAATNQEIVDWIVEDQEIAPPIAAQLHKPGGSLTELEYRLMWTRTYLRHYGLIRSAGRAQWELTDTGRATTQIDAAEIVRFVKQRERGLPHEHEEGELLDSADGTGAAVDATDPLISPTPNFPRYQETREYLRILHGVSYTEYRTMYNAIYEQRGSPQEQVDWTNPDEWVPRRLDDESAALAQRLWHDSHKRINPRHTRGHWHLCAHHGLLLRDEHDVLCITPGGEEFRTQPLGPLEANIDQIEGVLVILRLIAENGSVRRGDIIDDYAQYCRAFTTIRSDTAIRSFLYDRLRNLVDRELVQARGQRYEVTEQGIAYLRKHAQFIPGTQLQNSQQADIHTLAKQLQDHARSELHAYLLDMDPFKFESLIKLLLEAIGYTDVVKTSDTNDKGVDVVANIELGITSVREVVQVKRHRGGINRTVLDQLRGSLHRFNAVRGTIISTGHFSKGASDAAFERGAAPITLIDAEKLLDLLMDNELGVKKNTVSYYEFTPGAFAQLDEDV